MQAILKRSERAVASVGGDEQAFARKSPDRDAQQTGPPPGERAPPDIADREQEKDREHGMSASEGDGCW